ncbi:MAG: hypothetical protein DLM70_10515 [Chloroflexi bacterium]|nr:MAG: hypothetical protein DLM70_10515 [Chloroflexota bacterium]
MDFNIEPLTKASQLSECASMMVTSNPWSRLCFTQEQCETSLAHPLMSVYGAVDPGGAIFAFVACVEFGIGFEPMIEYLCVGEQVRNLGMGTHLITHFESNLFPDSDNLYLFVSDINPDAIRLYRRLGYDQIGELPDFNLKGQTEFLYRKSRRPVQEGRARVSTVV